MLEEFSYDQAPRRGVTPKRSCRPGESAAFSRGVKLAQALLQGQYVSVPLIKRVCSVSAPTAKRDLRVLARLLPLVGRDVGPYRERVYRLRRKDGS
jgi:hypothetical protein